MTQPNLQHARGRSWGLVAHPACSGGKAAIRTLMITTLLLAFVAPTKADDLPPFDSSSDTIRNPWLAVSFPGQAWALGDIGETYLLQGTGLYAGASRAFTLQGEEVVLGVKCLTYRVSGFGESPVVEEYLYRIAEDTGGNVRFLKVTGTDAAGADVLWQAATTNEAPVLLPARPTAGQHFDWYDGQSLDVLATGQTVARGPTGAGPFHSCAKVRWTRGTVTRDSWLCRYLGVVKEDWTSPAGAAGWQRPFSFLTLVPDWGLRDAVLQQTGKTAETVTLADLQAITSLSADGVLWLEGLQYCENLAELYVDSLLSADSEYDDAQLDLSVLSGLTHLTGLAANYGNVSDLSPLAGLTSLKHISIYGGTVSSLAPLAAMHDLEVLGLDDQAIADLTPLADKTRLVSLVLRRNCIRNLTPLSTLSGLTTLYLDRNQIVDLSPLASRVGLVTLSLSENQIADLSPLTGLVNIETLMLNANAIVDLSPLAGLAKMKTLNSARNPVSTIPDLTGMLALEEIQLWNCELTDISGLAGAAHLRSLKLMHNHITNLQPLSGLQGLFEINLTANEVENVSPLAGLQSLRYLHLENNRVSDFSPLTTMASLAMLYLDENRITSIPSLAAMSNLNVLYLDDNLIDDLGGLAEAPVLSCLALSNNFISDIRPLAGLPPRMQWLGLGGNLISYVEPLAGKKITSLSLSHNRIQDLSPLLTLQPTNISYSYLSLDDNPLTEAARTEQIPALKQLFHTVSFSAEPLIELTASADADWVYENTPMNTQGRHRMVITLQIDSDPYGNATYVPFLSARDPGAAVVEPPEGDSSTWTVRGGPLGVAGANELTASVRGAEQGGVGAVAIPITVRPLGDVTGDGLVNAEDRLEMNKRLNGLATLPGVGLRELDLTGDGQAVDAEDKLILNRILNGLAVP